PPSCDRFMRNGGRLVVSDVVLDVGGGTGINTIMMAQRCKKVTLVDISTRILELAALNIENP
ncbi:MAG: class I SAM-dependent methyltransferase, partial [Anaerolineales bacterium]